MQVKGDYLVAAGTMLLAGFTGWLAWETHRLADKTDDLVTDGRRANEIATGVQEQSERPILIGSIVEKQSSPPGGDIGYTLHITDVGRGPAVHVLQSVVAIQDNFSSFRAQAGALAVPPSPAKIAASDVFITSGGSIDLPAAQLRKPPNIALNSGGRNFVAARIDYLDMSNKAYSVIVCPGGGAGDKCVSHHD